MNLAGLRKDVEPAVFSRYREGCCAFEVVPVDPMKVYLQDVEDRSHQLGGGMLESSPGGISECAELFSLQVPFGVGALNRLELFFEKIVALTSLYTVFHLLADTHLRRRHFDLFP